MSCDTEITKADALPDQDDAAGITATVLLALGNSFNTGGFTVGPGCDQGKMSGSTTSAAYPMFRIPNGFNRCYRSNQDANGDYAFECSAPNSLSSGIRRLCWCLASSPPTAPPPPLQECPDGYTGGVVDPSTITGYTPFRTMDTAEQLRARASTLQTRPLCNDDKCKAFTHNMAHAYGNFELCLYLEYSPEQTT